MIPITYNLRSLTVRKATTIASGLGIALVVFVMAGSMMLENGLRKTMGRSGEPENAIVIRKGSDNELSSGIEDGRVGIILSSPGVAKDATGPVGVKEIVVVILLDKLGTGGQANVAVRGVPDDVLRLRRGVKIIAGRPAAPGTDEVIVGKNIAGRFKGVAVGQKFELKKNREVAVVGVFDDNGSSYASEVWGDLDTIRASFGREGAVSSVRVRLESPEKFDGFEAAVEQDKQLGLEAMREVVYYEKQSEDTAMFIGIMGTMIAVLFSAGAMIGAMITMYAAVANRSREVGTLRALGFSRGAILFSFLLEALVLAMGGGLVGVVASLCMGLVTFSIVNFATFSEIVFAFEPSPRIIVTALIFGGVMGVLGGFFPALRASRVSPIEAMRG
jgi:putative ABC transport system permease protein